MRRRLRNNRLGFTLVEALSALAIALVIGLIMTSVMRIALQSWERAEERRKAVETAQLIMGQLREDFEALAVPGAILQSWQNPEPGSAATDTFYSAPPDQPQSFLISDYPYYPRYYPGKEAGVREEGVDLPEIAVPSWDTAGGTYYAGLHNNWKMGDLGPLRLGAGQRLILVRRITPEDVRRTPALRVAGNGLDDDGDGRIDEESYNLRDDDDDGRIDEDLAATGGLMAVTYMLQSYKPYPDDDPKAIEKQQAGVLEIPRYVLRRGVQSPIGGALVAPAGGEAADWNDWPILADNVMHFGLHFQAPALGNAAVKDREHDDSRPGPGRYVYDNTDTQPVTGSASPETMWDSTRGIYDAKATSNRSYYPAVGTWLPIPASISPSSFAFYRDVAHAEGGGGPSLKAAADDIFPRRAHVVLVLDAGAHLSPDGILARLVPDHYLRREAKWGEEEYLLPAPTSASRRFPEGMSAFSGNPGDTLPLGEFRERQYLLLLATTSYEWAHYRDTQRDGSYVGYRMDRTGQRGTFGRAFEERKTRVVSGLTFVSEIDIPAYRAPEKGYGQP